MRLNTYLKVGNRVELKSLRIAFILGSLVSDGGNMVIVDIHRINLSAIVGFVG